MGPRVRHSVSQSGSNVERVNARCAPQEVKRPVLVASRFLEPEDKPSGEKLGNFRPGGRPLAIRVTFRNVEPANRLMSVEWMQDLVFG